LWYTSGVIDLDVVSPERLMQSTRALARWTRLSGTAEERASAEYVAEQLRTMGYAVELITHDAYISLPGPAALRVAHPEARDLPVITHSMGIATTGMTAELVYAGRGTLGAHANAGTAGKFALVDGRASPQGALDATRAGALGVVWISANCRTRCAARRCGAIPPRARRTCCRRSSCCPWRAPMARRCGHCAARAACRST
jgi:hypothetical protein